MLCYAVLCCPTLHCVMLCCVVLCYITLQCVVLLYVMDCFVMLHHVMVCYAMLGGAVMLADGSGQCKQLCALTRLVRSISWTSKCKCLWIWSVMAVHTDQNSSKYGLLRCGSKTVAEMWHMSWGISLPLPVWSAFTRTVSNVEAMWSLELLGKVGLYTFGVVV